MLKKVRVRGVLIDFSANSINEFYNLEPVIVQLMIASGKTPTTLKCLGYLPMAKGSEKLTMKDMQCTSRPKIWPTSLRFDITSSHPASFPQLMCVK